MTKLLSDIDLSRSVSVASFLELEAAARSCTCRLTELSVICGNYFVFYNSLSLS